MELKFPKIVGITIDSLFTFSAHAAARNKALKALAVSTCGMDKETLLSTYKSIDRPVVNYAASVWDSLLRLLALSGK